MKKTKEELVIIALQQRLGELVAAYETQIAALRADLTHLMEINEAANLTTEKD
mgnify:FL=1